VYDQFLHCMTGTAVCRATCATAHATCTAQHVDASRIWRCSADPSIMVLLEAAVCNAAMHLFVALVATVSETRYDITHAHACCPAGAVALASCLSSTHCQLRVLNLSGCEVTDEGAAALAAAVAGTASSAAAAGAHTGRHSAQGSSATVEQGLQELRLADNEIAAAGKPTPKPGPSACLQCVECLQFKHARCACCHKCDVMIILQGALGCRDVCRCVVLVRQYRSLMPG
jgi:hypothetical protein